MSKGATVRRISKYENFGKIANPANGHALTRLLKYSVIISYFRPSAQDYKRKWCLPNVLYRDATRENSRSQTDVERSDERGDVSGS